MTTQYRMAKLCFLMSLAWMACVGSARTTETPSKTLFDGETLKGWSGDPRFWRVERGEIVGETTAENPTKGNTFLIWEGGEPADFDLTLEFKLRNGNSGIQYRSFPVEGSKWVVGGYQADIASDTEWMGAVYGEKYKGLMARCGDKTLVGPDAKALKVVGNVGDRQEILAQIKKDDWNTYRIIARGNQCIQMINGVTTAEFSELDGSYLKQGLIALQLHAGPPMEVRFKNLQLKELPPASSKQILFLAGKKSHGYNAHEHKAGCLLLARCLNESGLNVLAQVETEGSWPKPWVGYDKPDAIVMYCDGYTQHLAKDHQDKIQHLVDAGIGVSCLHFGVEVEPKQLGPQFLQWIGGYFEIDWSVNPHWDPEFKVFPDHPIAYGVQPFTIRDEWYYHMRFQPEMKNLTPILSAVAPLVSLTSRAKDTHRGSNPSVLAEVQAGKPQVVAWAYERPEGGRGFGFTGGHFHQNWKNDNFRKVVINALAWTAKVEIPKTGIYSRTPSELDLELNQDYPKPVKK